MAASRTSKSQLYHYFAGKDALMEAVIELQTRRVTGGQAERLEAVDSLDGLRRWRDGIVAMNRATGGVGGCPLGSLASELSDRSESARGRLAHGFSCGNPISHAPCARCAIAANSRATRGPRILRQRSSRRSKAVSLLAQTTRVTRPLELALDMAIDHVARACV